MLVWFSLGFLIRNLSIWSDLPDPNLVRLRTCDVRMENAIEARLEAIEITMEGMKAESATLRRDLQQIMKILGMQANQMEGSSDDSSVNDNRHRVVGKLGAEEPAIRVMNRDHGGKGWSYLPSTMWNP